MLVPVKTWVAHVRNLHCPYCGVGAKQIYLRTAPLKED